MEVITFASGSAGNCILISGGGGHVLVDCGVSCRRVCAGPSAFGLTPEDLAGILSTHEHTDHVAGLAILTKKYHIPLYTGAGTAQALSDKLPALWTALCPIAPGESLEVGPFGVESFPTSHDAAEPMGFTVTSGGTKAAVVTDLGYVSDAVLDGVLGADLVVCEANHDVEWLKSGPYPYHLKRRILGDKGHLSNEAGGELARRCVEKGARTVILAHLSAENNTPARALSVVGAALSAAGAEPGRDVVLAAAPRSVMSPVYEV